MRLPMEGVPTILTPKPVAHEVRTDPFSYFIVEFSIAKKRVSVNTFFEKRTDDERIFHPAGTHAFPSYSSRQTPWLFIFSAFSLPTYRQCHGSYSMPVISVFPFG